MSQNSSSAPTGLTARASTFDRRDVLRAIAERMPAGATVAQIEAMADDFLTHPEVIRLLMPATGAGLLGSDVIRRADGTVIAAASPEPRWSTLELIGLEQDLVDRATARAGDGSGVVPDQVLAKVLATRPTLEAEQAEMVTRLTRSGNGIDVVSAAAGTGKTYTLDAARDAWQARRLPGHRRRAGRDRRPGAPIVAPGSSPPRWRCCRSTSTPAAPHSTLARCW